MTLGLVWLLACSDTGAGPKDTTDPTEPALPGVWRLGPPAPSFGLYGVAADDAWVYVSNQHTPWITIADRETGAWADSLSLVEAGAETPSAPELGRVGRTLYASAWTSRQLLRWDLDTRSALAPLTLDPAPTAMGVAADTLWVATADGVVSRVEGDTLVDPVAIGTIADRIAVDDPAVAWIAGSRVGWTADGETWSVPVAGTLGGIAVVGEDVYVTDRDAGELVHLRGGAELARVAVGADPGTVVWAEDQLLVVDRQGAALPAGGTYAGAPGVVVALDAAMVELWRVEVGRTPYVLAWDGAAWWTASEDDMRLTRFGPGGADPLAGPPLGITLDSLAWWGDRLVLPSHLTDELWVLDGDATAIPTCGWPLVAVPDPDGTLWTPCQMDGDVLHVAADGSSTTTDIAETFQPACGPDGCVGRDLLLDAVWHDGQLWWSDPNQLAVRAWDGQVHSLDVVGSLAARVQHLDLASAEELYVFEPRDQRLYGLDGGTVLDVAGGAEDFPIGATGPVRVGGVVVADGAAVGSLPGWVVAGDSRSVVRDDWALVVVEGEVEVGRLELTALRVPPDVQPDGAPGPMRYGIGPDGALWVVNLVRGTVERRALPDLGPLGTDEVRAVGRWAEAPGMR